MATQTKISSYGIIVFILHCKRIIRLI